jgi:hypothetical protein
MELVKEQIYLLIRYFSFIGFCFNYILCQLAPMLDRGDLENNLAYYNTVYIILVSTWESSKLFENVEKTMQNW